MRSAATKNGPASKASFAVYLVVLSVSLITLTYNQGFHSLLDISGMSWEIFAMVLGACGLIAVITFVEREWRSYLAYLSAILFTPTALGFSGADWLSGLGFPASMAVFKSDLPDLVCLMVGLAVVGSFLLGREGDTLEGIRDLLLGYEASSEEVDVAMSKAYRRLALSFLAGSAALVLVWLAASLLSGGVAPFLAQLTGEFLLLGLACTVLLILMFVYLARGEAPREEEPKLEGSQEQGTGGLAGEEKAEG